MTSVVGSSHWIDWVSLTNSARLPWPTSFKRLKSLIHWQRSLTDNACRLLATSFNSIIFSCRTFSHSLLLTILVSEIFYLFISQQHLVSFSLLSSWLLHTFHHRLVQLLTEEIAFIILQQSSIREDEVEQPNNQTPMTCKWNCRSLIILWLSSITRTVSRGLAHFCNTRGLLTSSVTTLSVYGARSLPWILSCRLHSI